MFKGVTYDNSGGIHQLQQSVVVERIHGGRGHSSGDFSVSVMGARNLFLRVERESSAECGVGHKGPNVNANANRMEGWLDKMQQCTDGQDGRVEELKSMLQEVPKVAHLLSILKACLHSEGAGGHYWPDICVCEHLGAECWWLAATCPLTVKDDVC